MANEKRDRFAFIKDKTLRENLNQVFTDITDFASIMYSYNENIQNNFSRAIILYTSAIVEALMHYIVEKKVTSLELDECEWCYDGEPHVCHRYKDDKGREIQIIAGKRFKKNKKITKNTQFKQINCIALSKKIITKSLYEEVDKMRALRNRIHLTSLEDIEKKYSKQNLNEAFETARKVVEIAEKL